MSDSIDASIGSGFVMAAAIELGTQIVQELTGDNISDSIGDNPVNLNLITELMETELVNNLTQGDK